MKYMMRAAYFEAGSGNFEKEEKKISTAAASPNGLRFSKRKKEERGQVSKCCHVSSYSPLPREIFICRI
jgi:hypothetical protein